MSLIIITQLIIMISLLFRTWIFLNAFNFFKEILDYYYLITTLNTSFKHF